MKKLRILLFFVVICLIWLFGIFYFSQEQPKSIIINNYDECVKAGYPVLESYPSQCRTKDGQNFTQYIGNELEYADEILVSNPRPNQKISSPLIIEGKARGFWFFEGSFSAQLFDADKKSVGVVILQSQGEWMTEDFVEFKGLLEYEKASRGTGELIIKNANPSGLPENAKELRIPIVL